MHMFARIISLPGFLLAAVCAFSFFTGMPAFSQEEPLIYKIGVLASEDKLACLRTWAPTGRYLTSNIPNSYFQIIPLAFDELESAVSAKEVDFLILNPALYVSMEVSYNVQRIATIKRGGAAEATFFGGVLFVRSDAQINSLRDLKGKRLIANSPDALGGWLAVLREINEQGVFKLAQYFKSLEFQNSDEAIVKAVMDKSADAGIFGTRVLEQMSRQGKIEIEKFKVIPLTSPHPLGSPCPFLHSTRLYPEWPFAKLEHTPLETAEKVVQVLLAMKADDLSAIIGEYAGWTVPLAYTPVHECLRALRWGPYKNYGKITLQSLVANYWQWMLAIAVLLAAMSVAVVYVGALNRRLGASQFSLQESRKRLQALLDFSPDATFAIDTSGRVVTWNKAIEKMTGVSSADMLHKGNLEYSLPFFGDRRNLLADYLISYLKKETTLDEIKKNYLSFELQGEAFVAEAFATAVNKGAGAYYWLKAHPLYDNSGMLDGAIEAVIDITARKQAEENLKKAYRQLQETQAQLIQQSKMASVGILAGGVAHEINNPLTGVLNNIQLVKMIADRKKEFNFDEFREYIDAVEKSAVRCRDITRALLEFSHTSADTFKALSLNELIEGVITLVRRELELQSIEVRTRFAEKVPLVFGNPQLIQQAVFNLVSNGAWAIRKKNNPEGGVITISTFESEATRGAGFSVADTGIGIPKEHMDNLFTPFFTTKDVGEGTGLGLSIVYNIVKDHRGKITAQSKEGEGTVFTISLPPHDAAPDKG